VRLSGEGATEATAEADAEVVSAMLGAEADAEGLVGGGGASLFDLQDDASNAARTMEEREMRMATRRLHARAACYD